VCGWWAARQNPQRHSDSPAEHKGPKAAPACVVNEQIYMTLVRTLLTIGAFRSSKVLSLSPHLFWVEAAEPLSSDWLTVIEQRARTMRAGHHS
jgi:hypothetical protein